ncbi:endo-1,3-alpha-glucanase family glycosylhydrolase [Streptomyces sp. NPDC097619]|uniref:glycoside hydrolase family 71 protein n=1 Tax=Streptomyces sp. NPDC097619 TaxID=3157228 RepID=UPI0033170774
MSTDPAEQPSRRRPLPQGDGTGRSSRAAARRRGRRGHRRRSGFRTPAFLLTALLVVALGAGASLVWDPFTAGAGSASQARPEIGTPWSTGPVPDDDRAPTTAPGTTAPGTGTGTATPGASRSALPVVPRTPDTPVRRRGGPLPFDLPSPERLRASGKLVFAHYFTPYPLSLDNVAPERDYYARNYLKPEGESGKHARYGGLLRDRPLPVAPKSGDWELANLKEEVRTARAAGLDGFTLDLLSLSGKNWERSTMLLEAARAVDPAFKIQLMPDMTSLRTDPAGLADALATLARSPAAHRLPDGRLVVTPFKAEAKDPAWWKQMMDSLRTRHGIRTALVPLFLDFGPHATPFAPISYGFTEWGSRSYVGQEPAGRDTRRAHELGKIWMQPVSVQDARPNQGIFDEAGNTSTLRATWKHAIEDRADWVQLTTWNDYSEGSQFAPSLHNGHAYLDLTSYYLTRFKTGSYPKIVRDTLYLTSRVQFAGTAPTGGQKLVMRLRGGSAAARDRVEVLSFLTAPSTLRTTTGSARTDRQVPAGVNVELYPLRSGTNSTTALRGGRTATKVTLGYPVSRIVTVQDLQYYAATSGRS